MDRESSLYRLTRIALNSALARLQLRKMGSGTRLEHPSYFTGPKNITLGKGVEIRHGCCLYAGGGEGVNLEIGNYCRVKEYCVFDCYGGTISLGEKVLVGQGSTIHGHGGVSIGDHSLLGARVGVLSNNHNFRGVPEFIQDQGETFAPTTIGQNVWIGSNTIILAGVSIADNCVVGAGAVVSKSIPAFSLALGVPARVIRSLRVGDVRVDNGDGTGDSGDGK